jgi:hypothetical protein
VVLPVLEIFADSVWLEPTFKGPKIMPTRLAERPLPPPPPRFEAPDSVVLVVLKLPLSRSAVYSRFEAPKADGRMATRRRKLIKALRRRVAVPEFLSFVMAPYSRHGRLIGT